MRKFSHWLAGFAIIAAILACNLPSTQQTPSAVMTAAALTVQAQSTAAPQGTPTGQVSDVGQAATGQPSALAAPATQCSPIVTAATNANVRGGPGTDYEILGYLPIGGTAPLAGRNDANTWWYIEFPAGPGGHAWIAQSVTSAACLPSAVQVVAAPPPPPTPTGGSSSGGSSEKFAVTHVSFDLSTFDEGGYYVGCPIVTAHITTNGAGDVQYHWTRSDGASAPVNNLHFNSAGTKDVSEQWYLGSGAPSGTYWLGIYIDSPNHQDFGHKNVNKCTAP